MDVTIEDTKKPKKQPHTKGPVIPQDEQLSLWLHRIWADGNVPESVELWQTFGQNRSTRGEQIYRRDFKPNQVLDIEEANKLANDLHEAAQNDCDSLRRNANYQIAVIDRNRRAIPLVRRLGPLVPSRQYLAREGQTEGDDEEMLDGKSLALRYIQEGQGTVRWEKQRLDDLNKNLIFLAMNMLEKSMSENRELRGELLGFIRASKEGEARIKLVEILARRENAKTAMLEDGLRTARNLLPGLFAARSEAAQESGKTAPAAKVEHERVLIGNFLYDVGNSEGLAIKLFGDFEVQDGKLVCKVPGIFSVKQYGVMVGVKEGKLPIDELEKLMPGSGHEMEITEAQVEASSKAGVTLGMAIALQELLGMVAKKKEDRKEKSE